MKIRTDWRARLTALVEGKEWAPISRLAGLSPTYLRDTLKKKDASTPMLPKAEALSKALGVQITDWFLEPEGHPEAPQGATATPAATADINIQSMPMNLPVMGNAACGDDGLFELNGQILDYVRRPPRLMGVKDAYALWIQGDSMSPWREHGGLVVVHPHQPIRNLDYVVVQLKPNGEDHRRPAYVKRQIRKTATGLVLLQFNPRKEMTLPLSKVLTVHKILDWDEAMGF